MQRMPAFVFLCVLVLTAAPATGRAAEGPGTAGVLAWGESEVGQLGDGDTAETDVPVTVPGLSDATTLSIGRGFGLALLSDGTVMSWGENSWGQLGDGTHTVRKPATQRMRLRQDTRLDVARRRFR